MGVCGLRPGIILKNAGGGGETNSYSARNNTEHFWLRIILRAVSFEFRSRVPQYSYSEPRNLSMYSSVWDFCIPAGFVCNVSQ